MKKSICLILSALLLLTLLCGCGGGMKTESSYARADTAPKAASSGTGAVYDNAAGWAEEAKSEASGEPTQISSGLPANTKLIYRASIDMESTEFDAAMQGLNDLVARLFGQGERTGVNATRLVVKAFELGILNIDNLEPDDE